MNQRGFSIVELMIGAVLGLLLSYAVLQIYLAQTQSYKTTYTQGLIQSTENAITNLVSPTIRGAGFAGCGSLLDSVSNLNGGGPNPAGTLNNIPTLVMGYSGGTTGLTVVENASNDPNAGDWQPTLDASLTGSVIKGSDVLIVLGASPNSSPMAIESIISGDTAFTIEGTNGNTITGGQLAAVSDCAKSIVFAVSNINGTTVSHLNGTGPLDNATSAFSVNFQNGSQFIPLQQTAFFVGQGSGGQSALMRATLNGTTWNIEPLIPGIEIMKVQYGIGTTGTVTQYVPASSVTNWSQVYAVRVGFLIAGQLASGGINTNTYTVLDNTVTVPTNTRIRHVFELTINLRNAIS